MYRSNGTRLIDNGQLIGTQNTMRCKKTKKARKIAPQKNPRNSKAAKGEPPYSEGPVYIMPFIIGMFYM